MIESLILARHSDIFIFSSILTQMKVKAQTLGVGRDFREAHFLTKCNKKQGPCNKYERLASIRINNSLRKYKVH